jgi:acyl carrier protein
VGISPRFPPAMHFLKATRITLAAILVIKRPIPVGTNEMRHYPIALLLLFVMVILASCAQGDTSSQPASKATSVNTVAAPAKSIIERVRSIAAKALGVEPVTLGDDIPFASFATSTDDLDVIEVVMALEEAFAIEIPDNAVLDTMSDEEAEIAKTITIAKLAAVVDKQLQDSTDAPLPSNSISVTAEFNHRIGPLDRGERYEDPLEEVLKERGYGQTDGGGTLMNKSGEIELIDVHMLLTSTEATIPFVIQFLEDRGAPKGSKLRINEDGKERVIEFGVREGFAIYLDGVNLPAEVYKNSGIDFVVSEIDKRLVGHGEVEGHWQGPTETALYIYGDSFATMKPLIADFIASYPLCKGARIVGLTR